MKKKTALTPKLQKCPLHFIHNTPLEIPQELSPSHMEEKIGVVVVNLGTPDNISIKSIRSYLKEFLSDRRVIGTCPFLWKLLLNTIILTFRPRKTAEVYRKVWFEKTNESPLLYYTRRQGEELKKRFQKHKNIIVDYAMRYGNPSIKSVIHRLQKEGCTKLVILPLYPQYAASTTATVNDEVFRVLMRMRWQPTVRICPPYESHELYINALKNSIKNHLDNLDWTPERIMVSFHGIPVDYIEKGDPYQFFCEKTFKALDILLKNCAQTSTKELPPLEMTFQSRFGPKEWLQPYTDKTLEKWGHEGVKKIAIMAPGFSSDCIETLEELQLEGSKIFKESGGTHFTQIPCTNDSKDAIDLYEALIYESLEGWGKDLKGGTSKLISGGRKGA